MTYRFDLRFTAPRKGDPPFSPRWHIYVKHAPIDARGFTAVTPTDSIESEIDAQVDKLIAELESLRKKAKKKYKDWRNK